MGRKAEETREKIDRTALGLFAEKGVDQATINDIATGASIAEGTIYRHYRNKEELIWGLFSSNYVVLADRLDRLQEAEPDLRAKLGAMVSMFCSLYDSDPAMFSFLLLVQHGQLPRVTPAMPSPVKVVHKVLSRAMERGEIAPRDPELATAIVFGIVLQPAVFKVYGRIEQPLTELSGLLAEACWMALKPTSTGTEA
jgi:AcrR family transcriptional regulator